MPETDPAAVSAVQWSEIGDWMHWLWAYLFCIVIIAFTFLGAHAIIPSLVSSGHLSKDFLKFRRPMYMGVVVFIGLAVLFMVWTVDNSRVLDDIYNRYWI